MKGPDEANPRILASAVGTAVSSTRRKATKFVPKSSIIRRLLMHYGCWIVVVYMFLKASGPSTEGFILPCHRNGISFAESGPSKHNHQIASEGSLNMYVEERINAIIASSNLGNSSAHFRFPFSQVLLRSENVVAERKSPSQNSEAFHSTQLDLLLLYQPTIKDSTIVSS